MDEKSMNAAMNPVSAPHGPWEDHQEPATDFGDATGLVGKAGKPLDEGTSVVASEEAIADAIKTVYDPEIPVNIYDLGLIYEIDVARDGKVKITMSLTAPGCPVAGILPQQVAEAAASVDGTGEVEVFLVWDPPWDAEMMTEDAKLALGFF